MISIQNGRGYRNGTALPFKASPNVGGKLAPEYIVLHDTASGLNDSGSISWLTNPVSKVSAHVVIGRDGKITQLVPFNVKAWHAGQSIWAGRPLLNGFSIGIEIINPGKLQKVAEGVYKGVGSYDTNRDPSLVVKYAKTAAHGEGYWLAYSDAQVAAVRELCAGICAAYGIKDILTHWLISPGRKVDTNPLFPLEQLRKDLAGVMASKVLGFASVEDVLPSDADESAGGGDEMPPVIPGTDYAAPIGTRDTDESIGAVPFLQRMWKSQTVQSALATVTSAGAGLLAFLQDWRVVGVLCLTGVVGFALWIVYRRSLVQ